MDKHEMSFTEEEILEIISSIENAPEDGYGNIVKNKRSMSLPFRKFAMAINEKLFESGTINPLPVISAEDEGKFLRAVDGKWQASSVPIAEEESF